MTVNSFQLIKILREKVGEEQAEALTSYVEAKVKKEVEAKKDILATKEDVHNIENALAKLETRLIIWLVATMIGLISISLTIMKFIF